ncbi:MAG: MgtC/SapB family protein [Candidatus Aminicenantes bacterium]|nr:MgtC/SapB family protein [Candidatus Aminicenantes bacterium]
MEDILMKLGLAIVLGGAIGLEREFSQKPAGLRTNVLICLGSTIVVALSRLVLSGPQAAAGDAVRVAAGVLMGVGFIGGGAIMQARGHVHGLTTAAVIWVVAGLGIVIGAGYYAIALVYTAVVVVLLVVFRKVETVLPKRSQAYFAIHLHAGKTVQGLEKLAAEAGLKLEEMVIRKEQGHAEVRFSAAASAGKIREFREQVAAEFEVVELRVD